MEETASGGRRRARSARKKKRKGFQGKKAWEVAREQTKTTEQALGNVAQHGGFPLPSASGLGKESHDEECDASKNANVSAQKLLNSSFETFEQEGGQVTRAKLKKLGLSKDADVSEGHGYKLQDATQLSECISAAAICSSCRKVGSTLQLFQRNNLRNGLSESLFLRCNMCENETPLNTSKRLGGQGGGAHEVNRRSVISSHQWGLSGLTKFCAGMDLPPPVTKKAYNEHLIQIERNSLENAEKLMCEAAKRLQELTAAESPEKIETTDDGTTIAEVAVTVDGTWQKRGHSSKMGVVFVISVRTGEILDYVVKSLSCQECSAHANCDKDTEEYMSWRDAHTPQCQINHQGSSESMEAAGAVEIFSRSVDQRGLRYTLFVGDGDSSCFGTVKEAMKDKYNVEKEECVGHIQKRMGCALRNLKKDYKGKKLVDGKPVGGKGRLTDKVIDRIQNYYGQAIRNNPGNLQNMRNGIWAIFHHMIKADDIPLEEQHKLCPKDTWCKFWQDKINGTNSYNDNTRLPEVFRDELKRLFTRLSEEKLLGRCLRGLTQNQNEAVNGQLWLKCPKNRFCGRRRVTIAVCETIGVCNTGAASKAVLMQSCGITEPGRNVMKAFRKEDSSRLKGAAYKVSEKYRQRRQALRAKRKGKADKSSYGSGAFGLKSKPEVKQKHSQKQKHPQTVGRPAPTLTFVIPELEVLHTAPKKPKRAKKSDKN